MDTPAPNCNTPRPVRLAFSLRSAFTAVLAVALPLGMSRAWGISYGLLFTIVLAVGAYVATKERGFAVAFLAYSLALFGYWAYATLELTTTGPYTRWYNQSRYDLAVREQLVGRPETDVEKVLGPASDVWRRWTTTNMETGRPVAGSRFVTTFNYAPFPFLPVQKFQVHCEHGKVQSLEMFDD
jgi:hypothetical protein